MEVQKVGFEVLTAVFMKSTIFWDIAPCSPLKVSRHSGGTVILIAKLFHAGFLRGFFCDPEDGENMFFRNVVDFQRTTYFSGTLRRRERLREQIYGLRFSKGKSGVKMPIRGKWITRLKDGKE
jgi:hypothetical protein